MPVFYRRIPLLSRLALRNILLNWRHSIATMLAIMGGFAAISLFDGFLLALNEFTEEHYVNKGMVGHVIVEKTGAKDHIFEDLWLYSLNKQEQETLANLLQGDSRVKTAMRYLVVTGLLSNGKNNALFVGAGLDEEQGLKIRGEKWAWNTVAGLPLYKGGPDDAVLMGVGLAQRMGCHFDEHLHLKGDGSYVVEERPLECPSRLFQLSVTTEASQVNALSLRPIGVADFQLREFNDKVLTLSLRTAQRLFDTDKISRYVVLLQSPKLIPSFVKELEEKIKTAKLDLEVVPWIDHPVAATSKGGFEVMRVFRGLFLTVIAVIAAMSVANSMMKSINERIREIGTFRSFGFRRSDIIWLFSLEGLFLGLVSCAMGMLLTVLIALVIRNLGLTFKAGILSTPMPLGFSLAFSIWIATAATLSLITFGASWLVSRRAAKMVIADALRHTA